MKFTVLQIRFMQSIGIHVNSFDNLTDADYAIIEDKVSEHLQKKGLIRIIYQLPMD